jgi:integrase
MSQRLHRGLPLTDWPEADRRAWQQIMAAKPGLLDATEVAALSPVTLEDLKRRYACYLGYVKNHGPLEPDQAPAASVTGPTIRAYIEWLAPHVGSVTLAGCIRKILRAAQLLAPDRDWEWLGRFAARLEFHMRARNKRSEVVDVRRLYRLGVELMQRAERAPMTPVRQACLYRDGLLVAMIAASALRIGAFARLEIGRTFSFTGTFWAIHLPGTRGTKYRRPTEKPLPTSLSPSIDRWLATYRRRFRGADRHQCLWVSQKGPLTAGQAHQIVCRWTRRAFGHRVNPHLFRDCAVTTICTEFSAEAHLGSALLDHIDPKTTAKHYNQAKMVDAVKAYQRRMELRE